MAMSGGKDDGQPMMEMNTTPLIDVMLVLLIMFIITIPIATHAVNIPLPVSDDSTQPDPPVDPIKNKLIIDTNSQLLWNGEAIDQPALQRLLAETLKISVDPELQFQPEPRARYALVAETLRTIENSGVNKFGFVGNEQYRTFGSPPTPGA